MAEVIENINNEEIKSSIGWDEKDSNCFTIVKNDDFSVEEFMEEHSCIREKGTRFIAEKLAIVYKLTNCDKLKPVVLKKKNSNNCFAMFSYKVKGRR